MKTLLRTALVVLLVAAVTAQSSEQTHDASSLEGLIEQIHNVVSSLGGFEGTINKLGYITKLVEKAYSDNGIAGWMARNLIKLELEQLKEKAMHAERDMINSIIEKLEAKVGISTYSGDVAENYILSETVKAAIAFIRESIQQIIGEIGEAQREHDAAVGKIGKDAMAKINERLSGLKDKLRGLSKKLLDKLTGRDKSADVYGGNGGIRFLAVEASGESYILSEMIKIAIEQLRERIFKYIEQMGEIKREAQKALGEHKKQALEHLEKLKKRLQQSLADLKDALLGRKTAEEIEKDIQEEDKEDSVNAALLMSSEDYVLNDRMRDLIITIRRRILKVMEELRKARRVAEAEAGEAAEAARERLNKLREELRKLRKELIDALAGKKKPEDVEKDASYTIETMSSENYILDAVIRDLIPQLRVRILQLIEQLRVARREVQKEVGKAREAAKEHLAKLREQLKKLKKDMMDALLGRKKAEDIKKDLEETVDGTYTIQLLSSENYELSDRVKDLIFTIRRKILQVMEQLAEAKRVAEVENGEDPEAAQARLDKMKEELNRLRKELMESLLGKKAADVENL